MSTIVGSIKKSSRSGECGATLVETALLVSLLSIACIVSLNVLGKSTKYSVCKSLLAMDAELSSSFGVEYEYIQAKFSKNRVIEKGTCVLDYELHDSKDEFGFGTWVQYTF